VAAAVVDGLPSLNVGVRSLHAVCQGYTGLIDEGRGEYVASVLERRAVFLEERKDNE